MKKMCVRRIVSFCLIFCLFCINVSPVFAAAADATTKIENIGNGKMFIQETDDTLTAIGADNTTHVITISIKYTSTPNTVYQWIINDYPEESFDMNDSSFWEEIIDYAETRIDDATVVNFTSEEVSADEPMIISSAGADLRAALEGYHGTEHSDQYVSTKVMGGKVFHMHENLWFNVYQSGSHTWNAPITISSLVVGVLGLAATTQNMMLLCGVLGVDFSVASMVVSAGKVNKYICTASYHRYVKLDTGTKYAFTDKIVTYTGYEDANLNSSGRASIVPATRSDSYSYSQTHFNGGVFDDAYENYILGGY